jgi:GTP-binding protein
MEPQQIRAPNKHDALDDDTIAQQRKNLAQTSTKPVYLLSGASRQGVTEILRSLLKEIDIFRADEASALPESPE